MLPAIEEPAPRVRDPPRAALVAQPRWRSLDRKAFRPLTSHGHRLARADRLRVEGPLPLRARVAFATAPGSVHRTIRIAATRAPLGERARTSRDAFVVFEHPRAPLRWKPKPSKLRAARVDRDQRFLARNEARGTCLGRPFSVRLRTGSLDFPPKIRVRDADASGSLALDRPSCVLPCENDARVRPRCVRPTSATQTFFGEHSRLVVLPVLRCGGASRGAKRFALAWGGGTLLSTPGSRPTPSIDGLGARRCGKTGETARFTARGNRFGGSISLHGGRCRPGRCGSIEPLTPLSHPLAPASWKREARGRRDRESERAS